MYGDTTGPSRPARHRLQSIAFDRSKAQRFKNAADSCAREHPLKLPSRFVSTSKKIVLHLNLFSIVRSRFFFLTIVKAKRVFKPEKPGTHSQSLSFVISCDILCNDHQKHWITETAVAVILRIHDFYRFWPSRPNPPFSGKVTVFTSLPELFEHHRKASCLIFVYLSLNYFLLLLLKKKKRNTIAKALILILTNPRIVANN